MKRTSCVKACSLLGSTYLSKSFASFRIIIDAIVTKNIAAIALTNLAIAQNIIPKTTININKVIIINPPIIGDVYDTKKKRPKLMGLYLLLC